MNESQKESAEGNRIHSVNKRKKMEPFPKANTIQVQYMSLTVQK